MPTHPVLRYFVGAYAWTWSLNLVKILARRHIVSVPVPFIVLDVAAGLGPLVLTAAAIRRHVNRIR